MSKNKLLLLFVIAIFLSIMLHFSPYNNHVFIKAFQLLGIWSHEVGHATMAYLVGYDVDTISIFEHGGSTSYYVKGGTPFKNFMTAAGGFLGTIFFASFIIVGTSFLLKQCRWLTYIIIFVLIFSMSIIDTKLGVNIVTIFSVVLLFIMILFSWKINFIVLNILGIQMIIGEFFLGGTAYLFTSTFIRDEQIRQSDTFTMGLITGYPYWFWGIVILFLEVLLVVYSMRASMFLFTVKRDFETEEDIELEMSKMKDYHKGI